MIQVFAPISLSLADITTQWNSLSSTIKISVAVGGAIFLLLTVILLVRRLNRGRQETENEIIGAKAIVKPAPPKVAPPVQSPELLNLAPVLESLLDVRQISELISKTAPNDETRLNSRKILSSSNTAIRQIQNIVVLNGQSLEGSGPETVNFNQFYDSLVTRWQTAFNRPNLQFTFHRDSKVPECLFLNRTALSQSIENLLDNAHHRTSEGRVHFHVTGQNETGHDWTLKLIVANTGQGYSPSQIEWIQEENVAASSNDNTVKNLIAVRRLAKQMGGAFKIHSREGKGSEISISLPTRTAIVMQRSPIKPAQVRGNDNSSLIGNWNILIIEDDKSSQEVMKTFLEPHGCVIDSIFDGKDAIEALNNKPYDLILMDVRMPHQDGIETTKKIRASNAPYADIPILAITADTAPETNAKCMMAGVDLFLTKPVTAAGLFDGIKFVIGIHSDVKATAQG